MRQLRNAVETMVVLDTDGLLDVDDLPPELADAEQSQAALGEGPTSLIGQPMSEIERWAIEQTLKLTNGNREETARILGIGADLVSQTGQVRSVTVSRKGPAF